LQGHLTNTKQSRVNSDAAQVLASSPKDVLKSTVFSCRRKAANDCSSLTYEPIVDLSSNFDIVGDTGIEELLRPLFTLDWIGLGFKRYRKTYPP